MRKPPIFLLCLSPVLWAQSYTISTVAGIGHLTFSDGGAAATRAHLITPTHAAVDSAGNIYVGDSYYAQVFQIAPGGSISVYAGNGLCGYSGDGGPAVAARLSQPQGLAVDAANNLYIADGNHVRMVTPAGTISTVAGNGQNGTSGDGGPATAAAVGGAVGIAVDAAGNLYICQSGANVIRQVTPAGTITTIAGSGKPGYSGDGGKATAALLFTPQGIAADAAGNLYVADYNNHVVRKISQGVITTVAGTGKTAPLGDNQAATTATLFRPDDVALDTAGNLYISDSEHFVIRKVDTHGIFTADGSGQGQGLILNEDGSPNSPANPAARGSMVTITATGEGQTNPAGVDGQVTPVMPPAPVQSVSLQIGGLDAPVISAGGAPNQPAGYFQVVAKVPDGVAAGAAMPIVLTVGGIASQPGVTISVQ
jgi:uncharacterized protein (TIGR03437 family)